MMLNKSLLILSLSAGLAWPLTAIASGTATGLLPSVWVPQGAALPLVLVQDTGSNGGSYGGSDGEHASANGPDMPSVDSTDDAVDIADDTTLAVAHELSSGRRFCGSVVEASYKADCLSDQYKTAASALPAKGGYAAARKALLDASVQLHALATANADTSKPAGKISSAKGHSNRALTPVVHPTAVNAKAAAIVDATKVVLLRSAEGSKERRAAYTAIAAGV